MTVALLLGGCDRGGVRSNVVSAPDSPPNTAAADARAELRTLDPESKRARPRPELLREGYLPSSLKELGDSSDVIAVVVVTDRRVKQGMFDYRISTAKVSSVLKGTFEVGGVVDLRQNGFPDGTEGGPEVDHRFMETGRSYTVFVRDAGIPNDAPRPIFHVFGLFGDGEGGNVVDLSVEASLPVAERALTPEALRAALGL